MGRERWLRGERDGRERPLNWWALARQHGVAEDDARALYEEARRRARARQAPHRHEQAIYLELLAQARQDRSRPSPGKVTRTMRRAAEQAGTRHQRSNVSPRTGRRIAPGKAPLTSYLPAREHQDQDDGRARERERLEAIRFAKA